MVVMVVGGGGEVYGLVVYCSYYGISVLNKIDSYIFLPYLKSFGRIIFFI